MFGTEPPLGIDRAAFLPTEHVSRPNYHGSQLLIMIVPKLGEMRHNGRESWSGLTCWPVGPLLDLGSGGVRNRA